MINEQMFQMKKNGEPVKNKCFCRNPELIENYELAIADETQTWDVHHRREKLYSMKELIERGEYFDVPPEELIFLTHKEHCKIDSFCKRCGAKKILCVETGEVFDSVRDAGRKTGINSSHISKVCNGKLKTTGGFHWTFC